MGNVRRKAPTVGYLVHHELFYPTDPGILARLADGENIPVRQRGMKTVQVGDVVDDIPAVSIPGLLEKGWIEEVADGSARE